MKTDNRGFVHAARAHPPEPMAILPDRAGACWQDDGCGVNNCDCGVPNLAAMFRNLELLTNDGAEVSEVLPHYVVG